MPWRLKRLVVVVARRGSSWSPPTRCSIYRTQDSRYLLDSLSRYAWKVAGTGRPICTAPDPDRFPAWQKLRPLANNRQGNIIWNLTALISDSDLPRGFSLAQTIKLERDWARKILVSMFTSTRCGVILFSDKRIRFGLCAMVPEFPSPQAIPHLLHFSVWKCILLSVSEAFWLYPNKLRCS